MSTLQSTAFGSIVGHQRGPERRILHRTAGIRHGFITRLVSPGDLGELLKPFVFLDYFESDGRDASGIPPHPHSGIATHTTLLGGRIRYADSTGKSGILEAGSVEWMRAGGGVWHGGGPTHGSAIRGYQLWVALPASLELAPAESLYIDAGAIGDDGGVRALLGSYGDRAGAIVAPSPISYLHVRLADGQRWTYSPPASHDVAWLATHEGAVEIAGTTLHREFGVLEPGHGPVSLVARGPTELVLGSAARHPFELVTGMYSVHTTVAALRAGEDNIRRLSPSARALGDRLVEALT